MPAPKPAPHFFDLDPDSLSAHFADWGLPAFRAKQVMQWVYQHGVADPQAMTNLAQRDRDLLSDRLRFRLGSPIRHESATDGTQKLLLQWPADHADRADTDSPAATDPPPLAILGQSADDSIDAAAQTECVMIPAESKVSGRLRRTACISSQVGCPVGCKFCASGLGGLDANLTAGQIVEQVFQLQQIPGIERITNIVFMGMGEPLANFNQVVRALHTLMADWAFNLAGRRITVSTVGLPAQIRRLADLNLPITLAISLHAPNDDVRRKLIPWAERVTVDQLIDAGRYYFDRTGREVTLEYILLRHVNDRVEHARELADVARRLRANINLIRYNEVAGLPFDRPTTDDVHQFQHVLRERGVNTHIRASRGRDIAAACGQLRYEHQHS
ncbi:23S rRNA (adenine(2503)-C(2))-methyltransferase RlmN [Phycisphaerales bacterium AB-hyl4]|uniref:Probable dual-specificity RNA methyltransferase RlmN n=1 Tax=Natronomicrosphaera hydrolytica TaxID=3242702 RepID=A0ABV4U558_9BACT